jgi:anaerobic glycerol-3-phosphate dehydrogenase
MPVERVETLVIGGGQAGNTETAEIVALGKKGRRCERVHIRQEEPVFCSTPRDPWGVTK